MRHVFVVNEYYTMGEEQLACLFYHIADFDTYSGVLAMHCYQLAVTARLLDYPVAFVENHILVIIVVVRTCLNVLIDLQK